MTTTTKLIKDITSSQEQFSIKVRVIRLFKIPRKGCLDQYNSADIILMDEKGDHIHGVIKEVLMKKFEYVKEGETYEISSFGHALQNSKYKFVMHKYKLIFYRKTIMKSISTQNIDANGFKFVDFKEINAKTLDCNYFYDVIGVMVGIGSISTWKKKDDQGNTKDGKKLIIKLSDARDNIISCTFWDDYTNYFKPYLETTMKNTIVVIIQFAKIGLRGSEANVSNGYYGTKIIINDESISEIKDFKASFNKKEGNAISLTQLPSETYRSAEENLLDVSKRKTLEEIHEHLEEKRTKTKAVTLATIDHIDDTYGWYYNSCRSCKGKVKEEEIGKFWCKRCNKNEDYPYPRFYIQVTVIDESETTEFTIFESEAVQFFNKNVNDILAQIDKEKDYNTISEELEGLLNQKLLFRVDIKDYNIDKLPTRTAYTVSNISVDKVLIEEFEKVTNDKENKTNSSDSKNSSSETQGKRLYVTIADEDELRIEEGELSTTKKKIKKEKDDVEI